MSIASYNAMAAAARAAATTDTLVDPELRGPLTSEEKSKYALPFKTPFRSTVDQMLTDGVMPSPSNSTRRVDEAVSLIFRERSEALHKKSPIERVTDGHGSYSIGSIVWPGLSKVAEECGEIIQVIGKLMGTGGTVEHWDGTNLADRMSEEAADLLAALEFFIAHNGERLDREAIEARAAKKLALFEQWHADADAQSDADETVD